MLFVAFFSLPPSPHSFFPCFFSFCPFFHSCCARVPLQQKAAKVGFLYSEQMKWARLWFIVMNKYLFQFSDNKVCTLFCSSLLTGFLFPFFYSFISLALCVIHQQSQQPQCGMPLAGTLVRMEPTHNHPHCFSIVCFSLFQKVLY